MNSPHQKESTTNNFPTHNTGYIDGSATKNLWVGGTIPYEVKLQSGDWRPFLPSGEKQKNPTETMACTTFSDLNCLEIQEKQQTGIEPNWSDRFIAKMSGTTPQGNYLDKVADTVRIIGLVTEEEWPTPFNANWNTYYADIPQEVINKAVKREIAYESIVPGESDLRYHLKQSPIQIVIPEPFPNHAVVAVAIEGSTVYYFDSYSPFLKTINVSKIHYALKVVLKGTTHKMQLVNDKGTVYLVTGNKDKRKIGIADLNSLGLFGDEPQTPMDTSGIPEHNTIVNAKTITHK
jgi:hypothetical protein